MMREKKLLSLIGCNKIFPHFQLSTEAFPTASALRANASFITKRDASVHIERYEAPSNVNLATLSFPEPEA